MIVYINSKEKEVKEGISLQEIVDMNNILTDGTAIAINDEVIPKRKWNEMILKSRDRILIIIATHGG